MARLAETLQARHGEGVTHSNMVPGAEEKRQATNQERYGAPNVFCRESLVFDKVQASLEGKRPALKGQDNPFAWPEVQEKIRQSNLERYGVEHNQQCPEVRAKARATNLERYGHEESLAAPEVRAKIVATNEARYGGPAPAHSLAVVEKARQTNLERWGVEWTCQHPEVRRQQLETMEANYGATYFASEEGRAEIKATLIERYGVDHPAKIEGHWDRAITTFVRKYGVTHPLQLAEFLDKRRATCQERYGVDSPLQSPEVYAGLLATVRERYGVDCVFQDEGVKERARQTNIANYGVPHPMMNREYARAHLEKMARPGPNLLERRFGRLNPELLFTGNGAFWRWLPELGHHKNPDFIFPGPDPKKPKKGVTKVVELFGSYWHSRMFTGSSNFDHEQQLVDAFADIGIGCLVVWESEFQADPDACRQRVQQFFLYDFPSTPRLDGDEHE